MAPPAAVVRVQCNVPDASHVADQPRAIGLGTMGRPVFAHSGGFLF
jgi:hypothetical protein